MRILYFKKALTFNRKYRIIVYEYSLLMEKLKWV